jgi:hypothetical protein
MRWNLVRLIFTWVWRFVRMLFFLTITAATSIFVGIPKSVERIADNWIQTATEGGLPLGYHSALRTGARVVATITLILGWLVIASFTVFLIRLLFF